MKASVIKEMTTDEVRNKIEDEVEMVGKLKMNNAVSALENPLVIREKKKDIARLKTEMTKRLNETGNKE